MKRDKPIRVPALSRVEGEGGLTVRFKGGQVSDVRFNIYEPPRFFEAFLRGRSYLEAPDITSRICGICPIAYMMSAIQAMETGMGIRVDGQIRELRKLIYCGEWMESHALHVYMLHGPDFLDYQDAVQMAKDYPEIVKRGLRLKKIGNGIVERLGGREIHPINLRVGGFYRVPRKEELLSLIEDLKWARDAAYDTVLWTASLPFPDFQVDCEFVALSHAGEYAVIDGDLVSNRGLHIPIHDFERHILEEQVPHSTSLHATIREGGIYQVGPMARFNLNFDRLSHTAKKAAEEVGLSPPCHNPFKSIVIRSIELLHACVESIRIIEDYEPPSRPSIDAKPRAMTGYGCTEAPRGICWHRYEVDPRGIILDARIVPPTSQNQKSIEQDLLRFVKENSGLPRDRLTWLCEQVVRNYDPCISCSCHSLDVSFVEA